MKIIKSLKLSAWNLHANCLLIQGLSLLNWQGGCWFCTIFVRQWKRFKMVGNVVVLSLKLSAWIARVYLKCWISLKYFFVNLCRWGDSGWKVESVVFLNQNFFPLSVSRISPTNVQGYKIANLHCYLTELVIYKDTRSFSKTIALKLKSMNTTI